MTTICKAGIMRFTEPAYACLHPRGCGDPAWGTAPSAQRQANGTKHTAPSIRRQAHSAKHTTPSTRRRAHSAKHSLVLSSRARCQAQRDVQDDAAAQQPPWHRDPEVVVELGDQGGQWHGCFEHQAAVVVVHDAQAHVLIGQVRLSVADLHGASRAGGGAWPG